MSAPVVVCESLVKIYAVPEADIEVVALLGLDLAVQRGELLAIVGQSGSGKTTLLNILGALDLPSAGRCVVDHYDLARLDERQLDEYRRHVVGHLWQQAGRNLVSDLTVAENIHLPQIMAGARQAQYRRRTRDLLDMINLSGMENKLPESLSGGEQQRAAIAVAIANQPLLLLADEPTGELDSETAQMIIGLLSRMTREQGLTTILVTHDPAAAARADRTVVIRDGRLSSETVRLATPIGSGSMERSSDARLASAIASRPPLTEEAMREVLLLDSAGRLQLREETLEYLDFQGKAALHLAPDHVELWPMRTSGQVREPAASPVPSSDIIESFVGLPDAGRLVAVLIDAKGRLQLPQAALDLIPFGRHITALVADGHIELWPFAAQRTPEPNTDTDIHASGRPSGQEAGSDGR